jgi:hypothetical protein
MGELRAIQPAAPWDLVTRPAWIVPPGRSPFRVDAARAVAAALPVVVAALEHACGVAPSIEPVHAAALADFRPVIAFDLGGDAPSAVLLDEPAARAVVDAMAMHHLSLRGDGMLTAPEAGMLEFLLLDALDRLARHGHVAASRATVRDVVFGERDGLAIMERPSFGRMAFRVRASGREGLAVVALAPAFAAAGPLAVAPPGDDLLRLSLSLPSMTMLEHDRATIEPGDCVLAGVSSLGGSLGCTVVTHTGWTVGDAGDIVETGGGLRAMVRWRSEPVPLGDHDVAHAAILLGSLETPAASLRDLGGTVREASFTLDPVMHARLWVGGRDVARGELCRVRGEAALRVLAVEASS